MLSLTLQDPLCLSQFQWAKLHHLVSLPTWLTLANTLHLHLFTWENRALQCHYLHLAQNQRLEILMLFLDIALKCFSYNIRRYAEKSIVFISISLRCFLFRNFHHHELLYGGLYFYFVHIQL